MAKCKGNKYKYNYRESKYTVCLGLEWIKEKKVILHFTENSKLDKKFCLPCKWGCYGVNILCTEYPEK